MSPALDIFDDVVLDDISQTAHHEAAYAVACHVQGGMVGEIGMEYDVDETGLSGWTSIVHPDPGGEIVTCLAGWAYDGKFRDVDILVKQTFNENMDLFSDFGLVRMSLAAMSHYEDLDYDDDMVPDELRVLAGTAIKLVSEFDAEIKRVAAALIDGYNPITGEATRTVDREEFLHLVEESA